MKVLNKLMLVLVAFAVVFAISGDAMAGDVFNNIQSKGINLFRNVRNVVFVLGGFGLIGAAVGAIFGRIQWKWFGGLAFGLVILAAAGAVIEYVTGRGADGSADWQDTITNNAD